MPLNLISNFAANSALSNLTFNSGEATRSVSKLSSGKRVVDASDDTAALAIGSRLKVEVNALEVAVTNTRQGSSLLQIADGTLARVQDTLNRLRQLSVQAGSQNLGNSERSLLDIEFQALIDEIDRLSDEGEFNGKKLFSYQNMVETKFSAASGAFGRVGTVFSFAVAASSPILGSAGNFSGAAGGVRTGQVLNMSITNFNNTVARQGGDGSFVFSIEMNNNGPHARPLGFASGAVNSARDYQFTLTALSETSQSMQFTAALDNDLLDNSGSSSSVSLNSGVTLRFQLDAPNTSNDISELSRNKAGFVLSLDDNFDMLTVTQGSGTASLSDSFALASVDPMTNPMVETERGPITNFVFKVGSGINPFEDNIALSWGGVSRENLGLANLDIRTSAHADAASGAVRHALDFITAVRADVGSSMTRLDTAAKNVISTIQNTESARSVLLDLDVAKEVTIYTSKQILIQSGISVLAQANQLPRNLLQLFANS